MQKIQYIKLYKEKNIGDIDSVNNNIAHGLIDNGIAILFKENIYQNTSFEKPPIDKMMWTKSRRVKKK